MTRHRWGDPLRSPHKTERECVNCDLIKVSRHEVEAGRDRYWTEFWRGLDRIQCDATPSSEPVGVDA